MALTEKSRSALYQGLTTIIDNQQAVEEMLSYFPARDVEEPVTKEFLRAEMNDLRVEMSDLRVEMSDLRTEMASMEIRIIDRMDTKLDRLDQKFGAKFDRLSAYAIGGNVATAATLAGVIFMALRF